MKRRWLRILIAYLIAGFVGTSVFSIEDMGFVGSLKHAVAHPLQSAVAVLAWPLTLLAVIEPPDAFRQRRTVLPCYVVTALLSYWLLSYFARKP